MMQEQADDLMQAICCREGSEADEDAGFCHEEEPGLESESCAAVEENTLGLGCSRAAHDRVQSALDEDRAATAQVCYMHLQHMLPYA